MLNRDVISILLLSFYLIDVKSENKNHRAFSMINLCDVALLFDLPSPENDRSNFLRLDSFVATGNRKATEILRGNGDLWHVSVHLPLGFRYRIFFFKKTLK